jgi:RNA polymerase sporulation-specific sigma factor
MFIQNSVVRGLRREAETPLFEQAQAGDRQALNDLMRRHDGLVQAVVRRQYLGSLPFEEALQAGRIGLWHALLGYDFQRGFAFSTYAFPAIMRHIWRAVKQHV